MIDSVSQKMLATIKRLHMIEPQDTVLVAVSGGPDSITLLHALKTLEDELQIGLHAAHLNHGIRGKESDEDAEYVQVFCKNIGVPCTVEKIDVPQIRRVTGLSEEEAARLMRYEFLERKADEIGANRIALGHTADDQVETVWLNLIRGAGLDGLAGMPSVRGRIIRPLIEVRRSEIEG
ncbi:MAG: tRNA lysidine(34) synthetase TilS, partial [Armatimonadota bacterium]